MSVPFADLPIPPLLARAIAGRGYETSTPVQAAVLAPELAGRDLLVSSQTGSGKTLAFGILLAEALLADGAEAVRTTAPRALVIAPTRELAAQVGRELAWLFEAARLRIGTFTGGTALGPDFRTLRSGVQLIVGTPGRLVDLLDRGALDLSQLRALVLDEADEMLDMGFKEDLERLLAAAPPDRRTLMFSATLPPDIQRLAATYQRDAVRVDARADGAGKAHADITFVGHLIHASDRLAVVLNVLLAAGDAKSIVFCRTRERVSDLHRKLADLGLRAEALAGDRTQAERDRALESLRTGGVRILVATDVAARGLDLPDVELVVHGDLPDSVEALAHRSGRTGRAGRKGTTVIIADLRERRKAERLLSGVGAKGTWSEPPGPAHIRAQAEQRLWDELMKAARRPDDGEETERRAEDESGGLADRLRAAVPERVLLALLLERELARVPQGMPVAPVRLEPARDPKPRSEHARPDPRGAAIFRITLGRDAGAEPRRLLPIICRRGGVTSADVGTIRVGAETSTFEIAAAAAARFARAVSRPDPREPHVTFEPVRPPAARPATREQHPRRGKSGRG